MENDYGIGMSYFKVSAENPDSLSICPRTPPWYVMGRAEDITCSKDLYDQYFKKCTIGRERFYEEYVSGTLSKLDPWKVLEKYRNKVLLGYYKPGVFDCRTMFARWIKEETGIIIPEINPKISPLLNFL